MLPHGAYIQRHGQGSRATSNNNNFGSFILHECLSIIFLDFKKSILYFLLLKLFLAGSKTVFKLCCNCSSLPLIYH